MSEELQKQYYLIKFKILQETYYAIWYTDDIDGFLLDKDGMLKSFPTKEEAMAFAREEGLLINTKKDEFLLSSAKYSLQGTTQGNGLTGADMPVRFSM
ncbi:hypothetical protein [uncultured Bacteroides sp.]|uniref:hypothetical protein n=1 Tax=uncultured Bacteroides sp. TaxID=162156 RepID=UPI0032200EB7